MHHLFPQHRRSRAASRRRRWLSTVTAVGAASALALLVSSAFAAQPPVGLGTAASFAVLSGQAVTNTGPSTVDGDLGVSPGSAVTGLPPGTVNGTVHAADAVAGQAELDLTTAYNDAAGRTPATAVPADLSGLTLTAGVYKNPGALGLTGTVTLNAQGDPNAVFIFQAGSTLTTGSASDVALINGAQACNVYWQVGTSATLGTTSTFVGNILALTSISVNNGVTVLGRALARNGAVTLINDTVTTPSCATTTPGSGTGTGMGTTTTTTTTTTTGTGTGSGTGSGSGSGSGTGSGTGTGTGTTTGSGHGTTTGIAGHGATARLITTRITPATTGAGAQRTFKASVTGHEIRRVVFSLNGHVLATRGASPFTASVNAGNRAQVLTARVIFAGTASPRTLRITIRASKSAAHSVSPKPGSGGFTG